MESTLQELIAAGESDRLEFKEKPNADFRRYVKTAVAFSNCHGGRIIFGVADDGSVRGLDGDISRTMDEITVRVSSEVEPQASMNIGAATIDGKTIVVLEIEPGIHRPYFYKREGEKDGVYIRVNATTRACGDETLADLRLQGQNQSSDMVEMVGITVTDTDPVLKKLCDYSTGKSGRKIDVPQLVNMGLLVRHGDTYTPTQGYMLLTDNPFPYARIECARFRGTDRSVFLDKKTYDGPITDQIEQATNFVLNNIHIRSELDGVYRKDVPEIPTSVIREIITNAVAHRSYSITSSPIFVAVYDDSVEITSPGMFPRGLTIEDALSGISRPRNKVLSQFLRTVGAMECWGSGISRSVSACIDNGLKRPKFEELVDSFRVILYRQNAKQDPSENGMTLDSREKKLINCIKDNPRYTLDEVSKSTGIPRSSVSIIVSKLKTSGRLKRNGSKKTGTWMIDRTY